MKALLNIIKYGSIGGVLALLSSSSITHLAIEFKDERLFYIGYLVIVIMPICTFLALKDLKVHIYNGQLPFIPALITGVSVSLLAFLVFSGLKWTEDLLFEDKYEQYLIEVTIDELKEKGAEASEIKERIDSIIAKNNSWKPLKNRFKWYMKLGLLYTIISFLLLKYLIPKFLKQ